MSWKTVSNVVNGTAPVRDTTRKRVEDAIAELGYRPTLSGRHLRQGRSQLLALTVPHLRLSYFADLAHVVVEAARERSYTVLLDETQAEPERERHAAGGFGAHLLDGLIISAQFLTAHELHREVSTLPTVVLGEHALPAPDEPVLFDHVVIDNHIAAGDATRHLIDQGRRAIAFLGADPDSQFGTASLRRDGYIAALNGMADPVLLPTGTYSRRTGQAATRDFLDRAGTAAIDALFCANDQLAIGAMRALREAGLRVPDDVAVVGWDGSEEGEFANPGLSTITPDLRELAEITLDLLIARIEGDAEEPRVHVLPHRLIARPSSTG